MLWAYQQGICFVLSYKQLIIDCFPLCFHCIVSKTHCWVSVSCCVTIKVTNRCTTLFLFQPIKVAVLFLAGLIFYLSLCQSHSFGIDFFLDCGSNSTTCVLFVFYWSLLAYNCWLSVVLQSLIHGGLCTPLFRSWSSFWSLPSLCASVRVSPVIRKTNPLKEGNNGK